VYGLRHWRQYSLLISQLYLTATSNYRSADKSLDRLGRKQATTTEDFDVHIAYLIIIIGGILVLFLYITRLISKEIFSLSNKIHREVGRAKDLQAPR
jgi:TRAP-type C4-dicarboxylate transport system permease small subunit